jgi:hypothetical protein
LTDDLAPETRTASVFSNASSTMARTSKVPCCTWARSTLWVS